MTMTQEVSAVTQVTRPAVRRATKTHNQFKQSKVHMLHFLNQFNHNHKGFQNLISYQQCLRLVCLNAVFSFREVNYFIYPRKEFKFFLFWKT